MAAEAAEQQKKTMSRRCPRSGGLKKKGPAQKHTKRKPIRRNTNERHQKQQKFSCFYIYWGLLEQWETVSTINCGWPNFQLIGFHFRTYLRFIFFQKLGRREAKKKNRTLGRKDFRDHLLQWPCFYVRACAWRLTTRVDMCWRVLLLTAAGAVLIPSSNWVDPQVDSASSLKQFPPPFFFFFFFVLQKLRRRRRRKNKFIFTLGESRDERR